MAFPSNRPQLDRLKRQLKLAPTIPTDDADVDELLDEILEASIGDVEEKAGTSFNGVRYTELHDGTGGRLLVMRRRPILQVDLVKVELPVLALTRTYAGDEIKIYPWQGHVELFTYKLAAENASIHLDQQVYGNLLPRGLPQVAHVTYAYGFAQYDDVDDVTTFDGGKTSVAGDQRTTDPMITNRLRQLQTAAICDAAASVLGQVAALGVGMLTSVSFDGFSQTNNPQAYGPQVDALIKRRDELLDKHRRLFLATVG